MVFIRGVSSLIVSTAIVLFMSSIAFGESDVQSAKAWFDKGMLFREAGDARSADAFKQAVQGLDDYIAANKSDRHGLTRAYTLRARCHNLLGNNEKAIQDLDRAVGLSPSDGDIYYLRAFIHEIAGHRQLSVDDLKMSARQGNEKAKDELKRKGIQW